MAQTGYTPISLYYSTTAAAAPTAGNLVAGELALNTVDEKLYFKNSVGTVKLLASSSGAAGDVVGPASATDNAIVRFDGTTGKLVQNSVVTIADSTGDISGVGQLNATTLDATNLEVTNIKAKDGTASATIADSTGVMTIGSSVLTTTDINGGTIDATAIGGSTPATGAFTTLSTGNGASGDVFTLAGAGAINNSGSSLTIYSSSGNTLKLGTNGSLTNGILISTSGTVSFPAGTVALPSITTSGDTNTGIYFPAADTIAFTEGGAEAMRINSSGNVGIGTSSPESGFKLHVVGNAFVQNIAGQTVGKVVVDNADNRLVLGSYFESGVGQYSFISSTDNAETGNIPLLFRTGTTERMRIDASGNVGIGLTSYSLPLSVAADANGQNIQLNGRTGDSLVQMFFRDFGGTNNLASISSDSGGSLYFGTGSQTAPTVPTERMRIDSSGNVGIGGSPFAYGAGYVDLWIQASTTPVLDLAVGSTRTGTFYASSTAVNFGTVAAVPLIFNTANSERMRIDSSGKILFNTTTQNNNEQVGMVYSSNAGVGFSIKDSNAQNGNTFIEFRNGATLAGTITSNGTTTMTYGSASDYRLKENLSPLTGALATVEQLKPQVGSWKADGSKFVGFVAHELQEVFPDAVVGEKDRIDADGNPLYQMVDTGSASIIATLTAAIQEQQAMIDTMKQEIAELKAKVGE